MPGNCSKRSRLVEAKRARVVSVRIIQLLELEISVRGNLEDGNGIFLEAKGGVVAVRRIQVVANGADLGRLDVDVAEGHVGPVVGEGLDELEGEAAVFGAVGVVGVGDVVDADGAADLIKAVVLEGPAGLAEQAVARAITWKRGDGGAGGELASLLVDLEDACEIGAQVGDD